MTARAPKPEPVIVTTICSLCDLPWDDHGEAPTTADCIRLLKIQLALKSVAPTSTWFDWNKITPSYPTYPQTWIYPNTTTISTPNSYSYGDYQLSTSTLSDNVIEFKKPDDPDDGSAPVPAVT